jgi:hypothetical protein
VPCCATCSESTCLCDHAILQWCDDMPSHMLIAGGQEIIHDSPSPTSLQWLASSAGDLYMLERAADSRNTKPWNVC